MESNPPEETKSQKSATFKAEMKTLESSIKDDKKPQESRNSGENHVKEALKDLTSIASEDLSSKGNKNVKAKLGSYIKHDQPSSQASHRQK